MRKIAFISISLVLLMLTYFMTYFILLNDKQNQVYNQIVEISKETNDYESFLKYQPVLHKELTLINQIADGYLVKAYRVTSSEGTHSSIVIFIQTPNENHALSVTDEKDQTKLIVLESDNPIFNSKENDSSKDLAYSYGMLTLGFYYYDFKTEFSSIEINLYGYDNKLILNELIELNDITNKSKNDLLVAGYIDQYDLDERRDLMDISNKNGVIFRNIVIFMALDISIYYLLVRKKSK